MAVAGITKEVRDRIQAGTQSRGLYYDLLNHSGITNDAFLFSSGFVNYTDRDADGKTSRLAAWNALDINNNGHVSLAEVGKWIQESMINHIANLKKDGYLPKSIDAKDAGGGSDTHVSASFTIFAKLETTFAVVSLAAALKLTSV